jgi:AcrR family transcriptional regulator
MNVYDVNIGWERKMAARARSARRRRYHHGDLPSALIAEARRILERTGPESISFRAIARGAGVSQTAPYNHFASKEHLLGTLARTGFIELEWAQSSAAGAARTPAGQIERLGLAYVRFACRNPQLYRLMFGVGMPGWRSYPEVLSAMKASFMPLQAALTSYYAAKGTSATVVQAAAVAAWSLVHGLSMLLIDGALEVPREGDAAEALSAMVTAWLVAGLDAGAQSAGRRRH